MVWTLLLFSLFFLDTAIPMYIRHNISFKESAAGQFDVTIGPKQTMGKNVENVVLEVPFPKSVLNVTLTPNQGKYSFDPVTKIVTWDVGRIDPTKLPNIKGTINLQTGSPVPESNPTILVQCTFSQWAISRLKVNRLDRNYDKVLQCQEKHINTCPAGKRLLEFGGFSVKYSKRATANLCKNQKDILDGIKCIFRDRKFLEGMNECFGKYFKYINDNMKKFWDGLGNKEMLLKSCQYLGEGIICTSRSTKCKNFSKLLKDFMFATMTERCYETTSYNSPFRVNSASVAKPLACILFLLMLLVCIGLV